MTRIRSVRSGKHRLTLRSFSMLTLLATALIVIPLVSAAQEVSAQADDPELIQLGSETYSSTCEGCHQAGGAGLSGSFPPLVGNAHVDDTDYLVGVIRNGVQGELVVNDVTYNGVMPAFSTLSEDQVEALVAYIQGGFVEPAGTATESTGTPLPVATGTLPDLAGWAMAAAFGLAAILGVWVFAPRIVSVTNRLDLPWMDAWFRGVLIAVFFIIATVMIPSFVLQTETVARLPREVQDVLGGGLWFGGLAVGLGTLWWAQREKRI